MPTRVTLAKDLTRHLQAGHPWVWADALVKPAKLAAGEVVDVCDRAGRFVARGLYDPGSPIAVRVFTRSADEALDEALVRARVREALMARRAAGILASSNALRLLHGEGDHLPGAVCDLYADTAVLKLDGGAVGVFRAALVRALVEETREVLGVEVVRVWERPGSGTGAEGLGEGAVRYGDPPALLEIREGDARFVVDVVRGQKTGFFLDQRDNRREVARYAAGAEVLNCFAYTGGFSIACALAGARRTTSVDLARPALEAAEESFRRSGLVPSQHRFLAEDCFKMLSRAAAAGERYGVVVLDPPSFAASHKSLSGALRAYTELAVQGLAVLEAGGLLATASCSSHVTPEAFLQVLRDALARAGRRARVLDIRGAGPDHPVVPAFPEGRYLKMILAHVV